MCTTKKNGFTLIELAIALMVIGLLIGGVLKGQELIENARITATIRDIKAFETAAIIFRSTYDKLPGDIKNPQRRIPNCTSATCIHSGNEDNILGFYWVSYPSTSNNDPIERSNFFIHLNKAGLIAPTPNEVNLADCEPMKTPIGSCYIAYGGGIWNDSIELNYMLITNSQAKHGKKIDDKTDDGKPLTGTIRIESCTVWGGTEHVYDITRTNCSLTLRMDI